MSRELEQDDKRYLWHPFTQMQDWEAETPLIINSASGCTLRDIHGNRYLDGVSSLWVTVHGHRKKALDQALRDQLRRVAHTTSLGLTHPSAIRLGKQLVERSPAGLTRVFYSDNGSTAVEVALKMAFQYWQQLSPQTLGKTAFLGFQNAYHGDTLGSASVGGIDLFHRIYQPLLFNTFKADSPYCYRCPQGKTYPGCGLACVDSVERILKGHHQEIAAVVLEPLVQAAAGMLVYPVEILRRVRALCTQYQVLLILDEVATGFGRTGTLFACEQAGVSPDFLCLAKGITGGYLPLAATLTTEAVYDAFKGRYEKFRTFFHGHTYTANPLACAVALANLDVFDQERTLETLKPKIALLREALDRLRSIPAVGDIRQAGFMVGIELVQDRSLKTPYPPEAKVGIRVAQEARRHGVIIRPLGNVIVLMPPLAISSAQIKRLVRAVAKAIRGVTASNPDL